MRIVGAFFKTIGCLTLFLPLVTFGGLFAYAYLTNPSDQTGWGALIGALLILNFVTVPAGIVLLLIGLAFGGVPAKDAVTPPP